MLKSSRRRVKFTAIITDVRDTHDPKRQITMTLTTAGTPTPEDFDFMGLFRWMPPFVEVTIKPSAKRALTILSPRKRSRA